MNGLAELNVDEGSLWFDEKWISYQMMEGRQIVGIGSGSVTELSAFYEMEWAQVK